MKLTMLGTGNALVSQCYNTCFLLDNDGELLLVDGGGGNGLLHQLQAVNRNWSDLHKVFVTHKHIDHLLGIIWLIRLINQGMTSGKYEGEAYIYGHDEVIALLKDMAEKLLSAKETRWFGKRFHFVEVRDGEELVLAGCKTTVFDIGSTKAKQFGFSMELPGEGTLTCCGDEPCSPSGEVYARGCTWLLHEAFCLNAQADVFHPYEKHHSTAKDAAELAEKLQVKNLVLYHTEETNLKERKVLYTQEAKAFFSGNVFVPEDLETIELI